MAEKDEAKFPDIFHFNKLLDSIIQTQADHTKVLVAIIKALSVIQGKEEKIMEDFTALNAEIAEAVTVIQAAVDAFVAAQGTGNQATIDQATATLKAAVDALKVVVVKPV